VAQGKDARQYPIASQPMKLPAMDIINCIGDGAG